MAVTTTAPVIEVALGSDLNSAAAEVFEPTQFTFNAELNKIFTESVRTLGVSREEAVVWAISLLRFAAQAKAEGKAFGLASDPNVLDEQIVDF